MTAFIEQLNPGSLRKLGERTGAGIVNRFGPQIKALLRDVDGEDWDGSSPAVRRIIGEILSAVGPAITVEVMAYLGYEYDPSSDGGFVSVGVDTDELA